MSKGVGDDPLSKIVPLGLDLVALNRELMESLQNPHIECLGDGNVIRCLDAHGDPFSGFRG